MLRKRIAGTESQQDQISGVKSGGGSAVLSNAPEPTVPSTSKKYKEFKF
ncbi:unnamed protein product [Schistosoma margrebowiei]|nr:unnamed protein product [Schistosoma margrebowiei]